MLNVKMKSPGTTGLYLGITGSVAIIIRGSSSEEKVSLPQIQLDNAYAVLRIYPYISIFFESSYTLLFRVLCT